MDAKDSTTIYRSSPFAFARVRRTGKNTRFSLLWIASFTDQFTFEDSLPRHARARPMNPVTGPFRLWQVTDPEARAGLMVVTLWCQ